MYVLLTLMRGIPALDALPMLLLHRADPLKQQLDRTPGRLQLQLSTNVPVSLQWVLEAGSNALELCVSL